MLPLFRDDAAFLGAKIRWRNAETYKYIIVFQHIIDVLFHVSNKIASMKTYRVTFKQHVHSIK